MPALPALGRPLVYLGPTLGRTEAESLCPGAELRPPIRRGELYRDRERGGSVFLILDGVFFSSLAVPPREILDVIADGALVAGASSLGAIRAAECWPAGMRGTGSIYRLYRRGVLLSDDEVALIYEPEREYTQLSVPLVNLRYALSRRVRDRTLERELAARIAEAAESLHYSERTWPAIFARAGLEALASRLGESLRHFDLKKKDAAHALALLARWLKDRSFLERPRKGDTRFAPSERVRERPSDPAAALSGADLPRRLARWQLLSGRYRRHLPAIAMASSGAELVDGMADKETASRIVSRGLLSSRGEATRRTAGDDRQRQAIERAASLRLALSEQAVKLTGDEDAFARALWAELTLSQELDAELFRFWAVTDAAVAARRLGLGVRGVDRRLAEIQIAHEHGFRAWSAFEASGGGVSLPWPAFLDYREELALACRFRDRLFEPHLDRPRDRLPEWHLAQPPRPSREDLPVSPAPPAPRRPPSDPGSRDLR